MHSKLSSILSVAREALTAAMDDELIETNPLHGWSYTRKQPPKEEADIDPFTPDEQDAILGVCPPLMRNQVRFMLWTGLRTSELIALTWRDIDGVRGVVMVNKAITTAGKGQIEGTKTASRRREVKILAPAAGALAAQEQETRMDGGVVFVHPRTRLPWSGDQQIRDEWVRLCALAKVRYRNPYQTRHTYASMMLSAREHPMWVAQQMGHSDWTMIAKVYGKWMPSADEGAGSRAEETFGQRGGAAPWRAIG